jgi:hypothetical protein
MREEREKSNTVTVTRPMQNGRRLFHSVYYIIRRKVLKKNYNLFLKRERSSLVPHSAPSTMAGRGRTIYLKGRRFPQLAFNSPQSLKSEQPLRAGYRRYPRPVVVRPPPPMVVPPRSPIMHEASPQPSVKQA